MELFEEDEAWRNAKMMIVYEKVARMNKTNYCRVEKSIRYAFSNAVTYGDLTLVEKSVGSQCDKWKFTSHALCAGIRGTKRRTESEPVRERLCKA